VPNGPRSQDRASSGPYPESSTTLPLEVDPRPTREEAVRPFFVFCCAGGEDTSPPTPLHSFFSMGEAIGGGETAAALAAVVVAADNAFLVEFPVDHPCFLFESAVHVVRSNGRASFACCKGDFRPAGVQTPSAGRFARPVCSPASFALHGAAVPPPPRRSPVAGAADPVSGALPVPSPRIPCPTRPGGADPGAERQLEGGAVAAARPHEGATGGADAAPPPPPPSGARRTRASLRGVDFSSPPKRSSPLFSPRRRTGPCPAWRRPPARRRPGGSQRRGRRSLDARRSPAPPPWAQGAG